MKTNWVGLWIVISLAFLVFLGGCPEEAKKPAPTAPAEEAKAEAAKAAEAGEVKVTGRPLPREALADTPDLRDATMAVTDATLAQMRAEGVPAEVVNALAALQGREFTNAKEFLDAARDAVGAAALGQHLESILRNSTAMVLPANPAFPGQSLQLVVAVAGSPEFQPIFFDFDRSEIKPEFADAIRANASVLNGNPGMRVVLEGHCDERGTTEYNLALGERRARSVQRALIEQGVNPTQLSIVSFGEERPADFGHDESAWAKNRRAVFMIQ